MVIENEAAEARRAIYRAGTTWAAMRRKLDAITLAGLSRELRAKFIADEITSDGYLSCYIANRLTGEI